MHHGNKKLPLEQGYTQLCSRSLSPLSERKPDALASCAAAHTDRGILLEELHFSGPPTVHCVAAEFEALADNQCTDSNCPLDSHTLWTAITGILIHGRHNTYHDT